MNALLNFSIRLTFVLLMINGVFLAAKSTGVYTDAGISTLSSDVQTMYSQMESTQQDITASTEQSQTAFGEQTKEQSMDVGSLIWDSLFGYKKLLDQIFPTELSWVATIIATPLMFLQMLTLAWLGIEVWSRVKPF